MTEKRGTRTAEFDYLVGAYFVGAERGDGLGVAAFVNFGRMQEGGRCATVWQVSIM